MERIVKFNNFSLGPISKIVCESDTHLIFKTTFSYIYVTPMYVQLFAIHELN